MSMDKAEGFIEVGITESGNEVIINIPRPCFNDDGGWIAFSPNQARNLARLLNKKADEAEHESV